MLSFSISYANLIKFLYFGDTTNLRLKEGFGGERRLENKVKNGDFTNN
jgi:hypothetical protein